MATLTGPEASPALDFSLPLSSPPPHADVASTTAEATLSTIVFRLASLMVCLSLGDNRLVPPFWTAKGSQCRLGVPVQYDMSHRHEGILPELARFLETSRARADDTAQVPHDELLERLTLPAFEQVEDQVVFASSLCEPRALRHLGQVHHSRLRAQL